jgi:uroporphyrinogen decarboxylase
LHRIIREAHKAVDADRGALHPAHGWALFERAWSLRGFEQLLLDMAEDPAYVAELLDRIAAIQLALIERFLGSAWMAGISVTITAHSALIFSPGMWRKLIKPRLQLLFPALLAARLAGGNALRRRYPTHPARSGGIGLTTLNPIQPEVLDQRWLRQNFGERLSYFGGVSTQTVLPHGTPSEVRKAVFECVKSLAPQFTGLWISPSHRLMSDIPISNVEALIDSIQELSQE